MTVEAGDIPVEDDASLFSWARALLAAAGPAPKRAAQVEKEQPLLGDGVSEIRCIAAGGARLYSGHKSGAIHAWDLALNGHEKPLEHALADSVRCVLVDASRVYAAAADGSIVVLRADSDAVVHVCCMYVAACMLHAYCMYVAEACILYACCMHVACM